MKHAILLVLAICTLSCQPGEKSNLKVVAKLPKELKEISGIAHQDGLLYSIEDSGNENQVAVFEPSGTIIKKITLEDLENNDWEDLTFDAAGNLYIGDFGNNDNERKDLAIYKIDKTSLQNETAKSTYKIAFDYPEQTEFPPKKKELLYDVEAFFEFENNFYLFTKNRSKDFDGSCYVYKIPNTPGEHHAQLIKTIITCSDYQNCAITSAAISPDGKRFVLLSHSKIWLFDNYSSEKIADGNMQEIDLKHFSQKEAVCFKDNHTLYLADEMAKKLGGELLEFTLPGIQ